MLPLEAVVSDAKSSNSKTHQKLQQFQAVNTATLILEAFHFPNYKNWRCFIQWILRLLLWIGLRLFVLYYSLVWEYRKRIAFSKLMEWCWCWPNCFEIFSAFFTVLISSYLPFISFPRVYLYLSLLHIFHCP